MKAVVCKGYGSPEKLEIEEIKKPIPKEDEVLVKVKISTVTTGDCRVLALKFPIWFLVPGLLMFGITKPRVKTPGWELAGEVVELGEKSKKFKKGDKVFGFNDGFSFGETNAEYKTISENRLLKINTDKISYKDAATLPIGGLTALHLLRKSEIKEGQKTLVYGASGSVGTYAVQLAKYFGAEVTGVCSSRNIDLIKSIGADKVIDYKTEDFTKSAENYDIILDAVGKTNFYKCRSLLKKSGKYATVDLPLIQNIWSLITTGKKIIFGTAPEEPENLIYLKRLVEEKKIKPVIDKVYSLDEAVEAYSYVSNGHKRGNVVLEHK